MSDQESLNADCRKQKQEIDLQSPADNSNQIVCLAHALLKIYSLIAQFKQEQSTEPMQTKTSCSNNSKDSRKKMDKGNLDVNSRERTKDPNDDDISVHGSGDEIEVNANKKEQGSNVLGAGDHNNLNSYSFKVISDDEEYSSDHD